LLLAAAGPVAARAETPVDLELVIAADVSVSMDREEKRLQQGGFVDAFRHPDILAAISSGAYGRIAVTYIEWGGNKQQRVIVPWMLIDGPESAHRFSRRLEQSRPTKMVRGTSISSALMKSAELMLDNGFKGSRYVINISGDGTNNKGPELRDVRAALLAGGITINGMPLIYEGLLEGVTEDPQFESPARMLVRYFEDEVIGGPDAFVEPVRHLGDYAAAIRRKLQREIEAPAYSALRGRNAQASISAASQPRALEP
jgi:hypothetical protein